MARYGQRISGTAIDFPVFVDQFIEVLGGSHGFGFAQEEVATGSKRKSELVEYVFLEFGRKVDKDVAAEYQVDVREGRAVAQVLLAEDDHLAQHFGDAVALLDALKETIAIFVRHAFEQVLRIETTPGEGNCGLVHIGGKDFDAPFGQLSSQQIGEQHGERIGFFAGGAACRPEAQNAVARAGLSDQPGQDFASEIGKGFGVAKELGDVN